MSFLKKILSLSKRMDNGTSAMLAAEIFTSLISLMMVVIFVSLAVFAILFTVKLVFHKDHNL